LRASPAGGTEVKFRKKPIVIEAHMIGNDGWPDSIWQGVNSGAITLHLERRPPRGVVGHVEIRTLEGTMRGEVGDWIVRGVAGEFYPCKPDIFAETYEPADTPAQPSQPQQAGVTEAMETAAMRAYDRACENWSLTAREIMNAALTAALSAQQGGAA
jgi:hypothetical protein